MKRDNLLIIAATAVIFSSFLIILTISQQQTIQSLTTELVAQSPLEIEVSPTEALDPFTDWQTYTDTDYGFEFKYPNSWPEPIINQLSTRTQINFEENLNITTGVFYNQDLGRNITFEEYKTGKNETVLHYPNSLDDLVTFSHNIDPAIFDQILSTFKFLDQQ